VKDPLDLIKALSCRLDPVPTGLSPLLPQEVDTLKAVIFDIYGTLFISAAGDIGKDSAHHSAEAFRMALMDAGIELAADDKRPLCAGEIFRQQILNCHHRLKRKGIDFPEVDICEIWREVFNELGINGESGPASEEQIKLHAVSYECRTNPVWPMPGAHSLLSSLGRRGIKTGIISNAQFYTPLMFEALLHKNIRECGFKEDLCQWSWQAGVAKPSPALFIPVHQALKARYGIEPESVLYVGNDMLKDILPALKMGWKTALFAGDRRSLRMREDDPRVSGTRPWCVVTELEQLNALF